MKLEFSRLFFSEKYTNIKFRENPSSGNRAVPCGQTHRQTSAPKNWSRVKTLACRWCNH